MGSQINKLASGAIIGLIRVIKETVVMKFTLNVYSYAILIRRTVYNRKGNYCKRIKYLFIIILEESC